MYYVDNEGNLKQNDFDGNWDLGMSDEDIVGLNSEDSQYVDINNQESESDLYENSDLIPITLYSIPEEVYTDIIDTLALVSSPAIYPSTSSLDVFNYVLNSLDYNTYYFIVAGSSSSDVYMYTGDKYDFTNNTVTLSGNTKQYHYYTYRPTSSSTTQYLYDVSDFSSPQVTLSGTLVYTNCVKGYPDIAPKSDHRSYLYTALIAFTLLFLVPKIIKRKVSR